jgi:hypothetical protein
MSVGDQKLDNTRRLLVELKNKYEAMGRRYVLTLAEKNEYKKQRDELMGIIQKLKNRPAPKVERYDDDIKKIMMIDTFGITQTDIDKYLSNSDLDKGRSFVKQHST